MATRKKKRSEVEWVGGIVALPAYVTGEGAPFRPETLLWLRQDGLVLGHVVGRPGEIITQACASLLRTIEKPMVGSSHAPDRVRVASTALAEVLRAGFPAIDVVCEPTPEVDAMFSNMRENLGGTAEPTYLTPGLDEAALTAFFRAAARLYRAKPWKIVPSDECLFSIRIGALGVDDAVLSVIGQMGESHGFILFASSEDFGAFRDAAETIQRDEQVKVPPHLTLNFDRGADMADALRKEITRHGWEIADAMGYPWVVRGDENAVGRPPTAKELTTVEAIALALTEVLRDKAAFLSAWQSGERVERTVVVAAHAGDIEVTVSAPGGERLADPDDLLEALFELEARKAPLDPDARGAIEEALIRRFVASPEARELDDVQACELLMDLAADYFDVTIASLAPEDLHEIVFDILPSVVDVDASMASRIIDELRAFFAFLGRDLGIDQADACFRVVGRGAAKRLERALSDPTKFGEAKKIVRQGRAAGFDMSSKEGIEAWMRTLEAPLPARSTLDDKKAKAPENAKKVAPKAPPKARTKKR